MSRARGRHLAGATSTSKAHIPRRRWPRRILVATNVTVALGLILLGSAYAYTRWRLDSIRTIPAPHLTPVARGAPDRAAGLPPENILLIGNETRSGLTDPGEIARLGSPQLYSGSLSDVIMILHLDPAKDTASILSIPRDLFLPMPPGSPVGPYQKIDAALNDGPHGPDNLIQAITGDLGIPINHYIELNFDGFQRTVDAVGGINVDFPEPLFDAKSLLAISTPGCQHLNGTEALALVRARDLQYDPPGVSPSDRAAWPYDPESDLSRISRDHTFLRILAAAAESQGLTNPLKANALIGAVINQITIDPGLKNQLLSLITHYRHLNPAAVPETTLPITTVGGASGYYYAGAAIGDVDFPVQPADNQVIKAWDGTALPAPAAPTGVVVVNITSTGHLAAQTAAALSGAGLRVTGTNSGATPAATSETLVRYHPAQIGVALAVMSHLTGAVMLQPDATVAPGTIRLDVGSTVEVVGAPAGIASASSTSVPSTSVPSTSVPGPPASSPTSTLPTPGGQKPSPAADKLQPWDPRPCT